ncbi:MAG TPA: MCE family protein [Jatrophihabitans sp.]|jgi:phospholipid/cholesterol/gamma-HCH transport system substrate-binding protein
MTCALARLRIVALVAAAALALAGCGFHGLYSVSLPGGAKLGSHPYKVVIYFTDVLDLVPQSSVKVNDVEVGKVTDIRLSRAGDNSGDPRTNGWAARVTVEVNGDVDLPANATALVKMTSLLGEKYIALQQPGSNPSTQKLGDGSTIPITRSGSAPEVEDVFGALSLLVNGGGFQQIRTITTELNNALRGNESQIRDVLTQLTKFTGTIDSQKQKIVDALTSLDRLAKTLKGQTSTITTALDTVPDALHVLSGERDQLVGALDGLSKLGTVAARVVNESGDQFVSALTSLQPTLTALTAAGASLPNALKIAATYPFPIGQTTTAIKGDYLNLHLYVDLNLGNELCGVNKQLCHITNQVGTLIGASG